MNVFDDIDRIRLNHLKQLKPDEMLCELLAGIHGDGGHHTDRVGLEQSVFDAEIRVSRYEKWRHIETYGHSPIRVPVWLYDGERIWIGARDWVDSDHWLYGHCYSSYGIDNGVWTTYDIEFDDDYQPTHFQLLPQLP